MVEAYPNSHFPRKVVKRKPTHRKHLFGAPEIRLPRK